MLLSVKREQDSACSLSESHFRHVLRFGYPAKNKKGMLMYFVSTVLCSHQFLAVSSHIYPKKLLLYETFLDSAIATKPKMVLILSIPAEPF